MTLLCVPISATTFDDAVEVIRRAEQGGAGMLELRLDLLPAGCAEALIARATVPILVTCRDRAEGGSAAGDDVDRTKVLRAAAAAGAAFVDFEWAAWNRSSAARRLLGDALKKVSNGKPLPKLVLSAHDFAGGFEELGRLLEGLWKSPADIVKIAYKANRITDSFDALDALHAARHHKPTIALAMGEASVISRLLAKKLDGFLTFAAAGEGQGTAPGQPTLAEFKQLYRWDRVGPATQVFGVIGCPVAHSMSPAIHNGAFDAIGYDGLYLPMRVEPGAENFDPFLDGLLARNQWLNVRGLSVTIPHKENALRYVQGVGGEVDELSRRIGAINTIRFDREVLLSGRNTDYAAAFDSVFAALGAPKKGLGSPSVAVIGAGGVARAIVAGFTDAGAKVTIYNRTLERAEQLAAEFGCQARPFGDRVHNEAEIIINATSIGMHPKVDESPLPGEVIERGQVVFDTIYNPIRTRLIEQAEQRGAVTVTGENMFVRQAAAQFEWWTGQPAPTERMRQTVLARLASR
jgi:3-dehydroquinate dehydratase/shikimate dehydrogenase